MTTLQSSSCSFSRLRIPELNPRLHGTSIGTQHEKKYHAMLLTSLILQAADFSTPDSQHGSSQCSISVTFTKEDTKGEINMAYQAISRTFLPR